jgi:hypothetical protein
MVFLMSRILELSHNYSIPSDLIHAMNAKISRRLLKLDSFANWPALSSVQGIMRTANELLHTRWSNIMEQDLQACDLPRLKNLDFRQDADIVLPGLDEYIKLIRQRRIKKVSVAFQPTVALVKYPADALPTWPSSSPNNYKFYILKAIEAWVASNLGLWLEGNKNDLSSCSRLEDLIRKYHDNAYPLYTGNPEAISTMLLTILELWIASDSAATHICELLKDYDPGVPQGFLESLVLPLKSQIERLLRAELYLDSRRARAAICPASHIFKDFGDEDCFAARYFNQSPTHQALLKEIERQATGARENKRTELVERKERYKTYMQQHDKGECEYEEYVTDRINDFREKRHNRNCKKCDYKAQAAALRIKIHEWPLPSDILEARSAVFELQVPPFFGHWRNSTVFLISDVLKNNYKSRQAPRSKWQLDRYWGLKSFWRSFDSTPRICLLSQSKPHSASHRRDKAVCTATDSDVFLDTRMKYQYYDSSHECFVDEFSMEDDMAKSCMYKLPDRVSSLQ